MYGECQASHLLIQQQGIRPADSARAEVRMEIEELMEMFEK